MRRIWGLSCLLGLGLCLISASVRGDEAGKKAAPAAQVKKEGVIVRVPDSYTLAVALTADGKILARGGADNTVDLWDVASGKKLHSLKGHTAPILRVAFSPDGKSLASIAGGSGPDDVRGEVKRWDVATGNERVSLKGHPDRGVSLAFSADGKTLASAAGTVKLWDVDTGKETLELKLDKDGIAWSLAFSPDGKTLAMGMGPYEIRPGSVILWDVTTGKKRATLPGHTSIITWVGFAPDGKTLASASGGTSDGLSDERFTQERWRVPVSLSCGTVPRTRSGPPSPSPDTPPVNSSLWRSRRTVRP